MTNTSSDLKKIILLSKTMLEDLYINKSPLNLYEPVNYLLQTGGKNIRALLTLLTYNIFQNQLKKVKPLLLAIESLHNFTLIHDDIMDNARLRRGVKTINVKWSANQAILSGDVLLIQSFNHLFKAGVDLSILEYFTKTATQICEGQQLDFDFQTKEVLTLQEYYNMIELKTGVLIQFSLVAPTMFSGTHNQHIDLMRLIGSELGLLFQIQDDYLDLYGHQNQTGKLIGGDVLEQKKTFLYVSAYEKANIQDRKQLVKSYHSNTRNKLSKIMDIYDFLEVKKHTEKKIYKLSSGIKKKISSLEIGTRKKTVFLEFLDFVLNRNS